MASRTNALRYELVGNCGIHRHRAGVLERIDDGVADDGRGVQFGALLFQLHLDDFLRKALLNENLWEKLLTSP